MQVPTDAECFRADLEYLKDDAKGLSTGTTDTVDLRARSEDGSEGASAVDVHEDGAVDNIIHVGAALSHDVDTCRFYRGIRLRIVPIG